MIRQSTIDKLHDMRLSAMSDAFECQCKDPDTYQGLSFEDRFGMLVDKEWDKRKSTKLQKLIRSAEFRYPNACMCRFLDGFIPCLIIFLVFLWLIVILWDWNILK